MHPLKKATVRELFPLMAILIHGKLQTDRDHSSNNDSSRSHIMGSDRSNLDSNNNNLLQRYGKKGRQKGLAKGVNRLQLKVDKSIKQQV